MSEAHARPAVQVSESLSWAEICARYCDQWVALVEIEWEDEDVVRAARVAGAGPRRADPLVQARRCRRTMRNRPLLHGTVRAPLRASSSVKTRRFDPADDLIIVKARLYGLAVIGRYPSRSTPPHPNAHRARDHR